MLSSPTMVEPSSSIQVSTTGPDSVALNLNWIYGLAEIGRLEIGREDFLAVHRGGELVEDLARDHLAVGALALAGFHDVRDERLHLDEVALLGFLLVELDARFDGCAAIDDLLKKRVGMWLAQRQPPQPPIVTFTCLLAV